MINATSLYEACGDRFASYPLAVEPAGTASSMVLLHQDEGDARFFILTADHYEGQPSYTVRRWRSAEGARIGLNRRRGSRGVRKRYSPQRADPPPRIPFGMA